MKKLTTIAVVAGLIPSLLVGCAGKEESAKETAKSTSTTQTATVSPASAGNTEVSGTITYLTNRTDWIGSKYDEFAKRFKEKYPKVEVKFEALKEYDRDAKVRLASGEYPDVMNIPPTITVSELPNFYAPLDDLGLNDRIRFKDYRSVGGKLYGIALGVDTVGVVYNKKAFADAGVTKIPQSLDEFYAAADKLKAKGIVPLASNFKDQWPLYPFSGEVPIAISGNANLYNDRVKSDTPFTMDGPYGKSFSIVKTMMDKGYLEPDVNSTNWEQSKKDVASGKFAMFFLGQWVIPQVIESGTTTDNVGFFPFPYDNAGGKNVTLAPSSQAFGVNKSSKNMAAAKAFVKWMIEESGADNDTVSVLKDKKPVIPQLVEFDSFKPNYIEVAVDTVDNSAIINKAQITKEAIVQEFMLHKNPQEILTKYNEKWAKAKKEVVK